MQMASKYIKICSTLLSTKEMQIKTSLRFYLIPGRMTIIKKKTTHARQDVGKWEPSYTAGGNVN
jgi:hypothetical protein